MVLEVIKEDRAQPDQKVQEEIQEFLEKRAYQVKLTNHIREFFNIYTLKKYKLVVSMINNLETFN
jgi:hypothetical protein